jgi:hypothetical protein
MINAIMPATRPAHVSNTTGPKERPFVLDMRLINSFQREVAAPHAWPSPATKSLAKILLATFAPLLSWCKGGTLLWASDRPTAVRQPGHPLSISGPVSFAPPPRGGFAFIAAPEVRACGDCSNHWHQGYHSIAVFITTSLAPYFRERRKHEVLRTLLLGHLCIGRLLKARTGTCSGKAWIAAAAPSIRPSVPYPRRVLRIHDAPESERLHATCRAGARSGGRRGRC